MERQGRNFAPPARIGRNEAQPETGVGPSPPEGAPRCGYFGFAPGTDLPNARGGLAFRGLALAAFAKLVIDRIDQPARE